MSQAKQSKQLKKNDFLAAIPPEPITKGDLVDALDEYDFLASWLDYLIEHFKEAGRIVVNEDGTIQRNVGKSSVNGPRMAYVVAQDADTGELAILERKLETHEQLDKEKGEAATPQAAVKRARQSAFASYKGKVAQINALLPDEKSESDE